MALRRDYAWALFALMHSICLAASAGLQMTDVRRQAVIDSFEGAAARGMLACRPQEPAAHFVSASVAHAVADRDLGSALNYKTMRLAEEQVDPYIGAMAAW